jgi:hypothetical protein
MGRTLGTIRVGGCTLRWERERASLADGEGSRVIEVVPANGGIREEALAKGPGRAILATRETAILADGEGFTLAEASHGEKILGAFALGDLAALFGREEVALYGFPTGAQAAFVGVAGGLRPELASSRGDLAAVPSREHVYIVDGKAGTIRDAAVEGRITAVAVAADRVTVKYGTRSTAVFDRAGDPAG